MIFQHDPRAEGLRVEVWLGGGYFGTGVLSGRYTVGDGEMRLYEDQEGAMHLAEDLCPEGGSGRLEA